MDVHFVRESRSDAAIELATDDASKFSLLAEAEQVCDDMNWLVTCRPKQTQPNSLSYNFYISD